MTTWAPERNRRLATEDRQHAKAVAKREPSRGHSGKRRHVLQAAAADGRLTRSAVAVLSFALHRWSDDTAKKFWPSQRKIAELTGCSESTVQRSLRELEVLGYLKVFRGKFYRGSDGKIIGRKTNRYYPCVPSRDHRALPAPRRRLRASYCAVTTRHPSLRRRHPSRSDLPGANAAISPSRGAHPGEAPQVSVFKPTAVHSDDSHEPSETERAAFAAHIATARALLPPRPHRNKRR